VSDYSQWVETVANLCVLLETIDDATAANPSTDDNFNQILPKAIEYAEQRMYRELDLLGTFDTATAAFTANNRSLAVPGDLVVLQNLNVITPAGVAPTASNARRYALQRVSYDMLNWFWPSGQTTDEGGIPRWFAMPDDVTVAVGPAPDAAYTAEFIGTVRPAALSSSNTSTLLTTYAPDAFNMCAMVFMTAYQRNWSAQAGDPQAAQSWEMQYQKAKGSIDIEAARQKSQAPQWQSYSPTQLATPPRT
jgi:hypothetical protein